MPRPYIDNTHMPTALNVRQRIIAATRHIKWLKRFDRVATGTIILGGVAVVASVLGILVFILAEAKPLFDSPRITLLRSTRLGSDSDAALPLVIGTDEYLKYTYTLSGDARARIFSAEDGREIESTLIEGFDDALVTAASRSPSGDFIAAGTSDGRLALMQFRFLPRYEGETMVDLDRELRLRATITLDPERRAARDVSYIEDEGRKLAAGLFGANDIRVYRTSDEGGESFHGLHVNPNERATRVRVSPQQTLIVGTDIGRVYHWDLSSEPRLTDVSPASAQPITALEWLLGGATFLAGDASGETSGWFRARPNESSDDQAMLKTRRFPKVNGVVRAIAVSSRERSFLVVGDGGSASYHFFTNGRTLSSWTLPAPPANIALIAPRGDVALVLGRDGTLLRYGIDIPHPEASFAALLRKIWYEGYSRAEYVWQSTGMSNVFESKLSLIPLIFGTIKGTIYAMIFAIPIAVLGALYTSQFVHPSVKAKIKPTVEIMAAVPSVVIGFIAGLWLAPIVEKHVVGVFLMFILLPLSGTTGVLLWTQLPRALRHRMRTGMEVFVILPLLIAGGWVALRLGPAVERMLFDGEFQLWLTSTLGLTYDQRNCFVVGVALGIAVIPIIFTISEDAFSSVPSSLTAASLALGASRWQTAVRVVLPTASPGVFSAIMVGFGRAVGETMIVLMATGNTPVMEWSIFNGMRTLSANIAVEIPEAPYGGTLYRVLFLSGAVLFAMTFIVNTLAEVIRQRLRERYRAHSL
ncbi:MAG: ABC transporter permease subunit [Vicinamibacteria bacterium]|nr:ABC transporter permease subunit [Vicinamibacteria bacterium]